MAPSNVKKSLSEVAKTNPTQLGDPVSLKAETSSTQPTKDDRPNSSPKPSLKERAEQGMKEGNPTMLGDPVSLKAETSNSEPTPDDRGALGTKQRKGTDKPLMGKPKL